MAVINANIYLMTYYECMISVKFPYTADVTKKQYYTIYSAL